ncbi:zinc carboxypeptidase [Actinomadura pelletieri DSM 43383]|uniref:Zinc carboxypeptidase n=1 Tax=Actinomadura pelletieri DSM 43383 TaxID=1120940 RepID=A0A495QUA3_9ACTN|nr:M14 family metallopeptidase [Actinomadura pelletieri]RKS77011.1 zinc carboxypeptidase [Actinomadura pelletieri DSM 43383]
MRTPTLKAALLAACLVGALLPAVPASATSASGSPATAAQAAPASAAKRYLVTGPDSARERSRVARTGASIDLLRPDGALEVSAIPAEVAAIKRLGFTLTPLEGFPRYRETAQSYHTHAETMAELDRVVAAYPQIAKKFSIGRTYEGRDIVGVKISDNVATDEDEPEVFYQANIHARERITNEQALYFIDVLTKEYATTARITKLVNEREFWIIPILNVDGQIYDMTSDTQAGRMWRKNRQGVDLNRNYPYKWGCCGGSSGTPSSETYRGPSAGSAPEVRAVTSFIRSRNIGGKQQIKMFLDIHSVANLVLWPMGYTYNDTVPGEFTADDEAAHRTIGREVARHNRYTPQQSSDLYITDGSSNDWTWGDQRIFSYTFELGGGSFYPAPSQIESLTQVNREPLLLLAEYADCPYRAINKQDQYCKSL